MSTKYKPFIFICLCVFSWSEGLSAPLASLRPINPAEAIIDALWDMESSGLQKWEISAHGLRAEQSWDKAVLNWTAGEDQPSTLRMRRTFDFDITGYNQLIVSMTAPPNARLHLSATTDAGGFETVETAADKKLELTLDIPGATVLKEVALEIHPSGQGDMVAFLSWVGLCKTEALGDVLSMEKKLRPDWILEGYLKPESYKPKFKPAYGIVLSHEQLKQIRNRHKEYIENGKTSWIRQHADRVRHMRPPEDNIGDYVPFSNVGTFRRPRDYHKQLFSRWGPGSLGPSAALAGLVFEDEELLRLGARYALSFALCRVWDEAFMVEFPGSAWEHRAFVPSFCAHDVAFIMDAAGELLTEKAKNLMLRRLTENLGFINHSFWRWDYIYSCNQAAVFSTGRLLAQCVVERHYPRAAPYTELAYQELMSSLNTVLEEDGGYVEGPTYFFATFLLGFHALDYYGAARNMGLLDIIPENLKKTADFSAVIVSTADPYGVVPVADSTGWVDVDTVALLAAMMPDSQWVRIYHQSRQGQATDGSAGFFEDKWAQAIPSDIPELPAYVELPVTCWAASHRNIGDHILKIFLRGNRSGATHNHEDIGSFIIEFAGDVFALDPGIIDYRHPLVNAYKQAQRHNMLIPTGIDGRASYGGAQIINKATVRPSGRGDAATFYARMDLAESWPEFYKKWVRTWDAPTPDRLVITDDYELAKGDGVAFLWQTLLPVAIDAGTAVITGRQASVRITPDPDCSLSVDHLDLIDDGRQNRIIIEREGKKGKLSVGIQFIPNNK